jgi:hypothetical protein
MTPNVYFLLIVVGLPVALLLIALVGASMHHDDNEQLLDWKPTRSPREEAALHSGDTQQMLNALNRYRRMRGAPECSLQDITRHDWANPQQYD